MPDYSAAALRQLAAFLPVFEAPDFSFSSTESPIEVGEDGTLLMRGYDYHPQVWKLLKTLDQRKWIYQDEHFQWTEWKGTEEAQAFLKDPATLAQATLEQLARLMTVMVRQEPFVEGTLMDFWNSGLLLGILRRVAELAKGESA